MVNLPSEVREAGWGLHQALHAAHFPFSAMFWAEFDDDDWRIFLATPLVDEPDVQNPYQNLNEVLNTLPQNIREAISLSDIVLVRPEARIVSEVHRRYGTVEGDRRTVRRISLSPNEAYVYELRPVVQREPAGAAA